MSHKLVSLHIGDGEYYTRIDADAVIAELKARIADGDRDFDWAEHQNEMLLQIVRHHKYKRCLAMAKICENKLGTVVKPGWWDKWRRRWLELAERFK